MSYGMTFNYTIKYIRYEIVVLDRIVIAPSHFHLTRSTTGIALHAAEVQNCRIKCIRQYVSTLSLEHCL